MNNFVIDTPDNFWQIRWLDKYMEGHKGFIAGGCFKNILSGERVKDIDIFFESESDFQEAIDSFNDEKHQKEGWKFKYRNEKVCAFQKEGEKDGLYLIYGNGHAEPFAGENFKKNVRYIGLKHKDVSFAISLTEHDSVRLLDDDSREKSGSETYYERKCDALFDIDGRGNTERLVARNPKLKNLLKDGEYIPSLGQLNLMAHYMDELNKAFAYVSASPLSSTWYRSSTESSPSVAWYVDFSIGSAYYSDKYNSSRVRAVIDF